VIEVVVHDPEWDEYATVEVADHASWWHVCARLESVWDCAPGYVLTHDGARFDGGPPPRALPQPVRLTYHAPR
jgi:hypothetical protein